MGGQVVPGAHSIPGSLNNKYWQVRRTAECPQGQVARQVGGSEVCCCMVCVLLPFSVKAQWPFRSAVLEAGERVWAPHLVPGDRLTIARLA